MKKEFWLVAILAVIIVVLAGFLLLPAKKKLDNKGFYGDEKSIQILMAQPDMEISSPFKINGKVNGDGWAGFEGQVGTVKLLDYKGNQLGETAILQATTEWTTLPTNFEATLNFTAGTAGPGTLVFKNENPSGDPVRDKTLTLPVKIKSSGETTTLKVYFGKNEITGSTCSVVFPVERIVPKTEAVARAALQELLKGPTEQEKSQGYFSGINSGVKIQSLTIENGTAKVDFDDTLEKAVGGSCRVSEIRSEINFTLKQFPTVKNVVISINGRTEDILQP